MPTRADERFENVQKAVYYLGIVTDKQYCLVKREGTRYRVPVGTRFYRVKVKPLPPNSRTSSLSESEQGTMPCTPGGRKSSVSDAMSNTPIQSEVFLSASKTSTECKSYTQSDFEVCAKKNELKY